jgi:MFS family permease
MAFPHSTVRRPARPARFAPLAMAAVFGAATLAAPVRDARADEVSSTGKGVTGGALLGAETVTIIEALAGVRTGWAYGVGALAGAIGGGVGGFFVEQASNDGRAPTYMLAGGLALIIPALVLTLNATRYVPEEGASEDRAPIAPAAEPGVPSGPAAAPLPDVGTPAPPPEPPLSPPPPQTQLQKAPARGARVAAIRASLVDVREGDLRLGVPVPDVVSAFSVREERQYGMASVTELRLPVLHVTF